MLASAKGLPFFPSCSLYASWQKKTDAERASGINDDGDGSDPHAARPGLSQGALWLGRLNVAPQVAGHIAMAPGSGVESVVE